MGLWDGKREEKGDGKEVLQDGGGLSMYDVTAPTTPPEKVKYSSPNYKYSLSKLFNLSVPQFPPL